MIVCGIYKDHAFFVDGSGIDAGMECCHILNPSQFYLDDKVVMPLSLPGIIRTSKLKNILVHGNGYGPSCGYGDPSNGTLEINSLAEVHTYQFLSSDKKGYAKQNVLVKRFLGFTNSDLNFGMASYNTSTAALTNVLNTDGIDSIEVFVQDLYTQLNCTRYLRLEKKAWYIPLTELINSLEYVNDGTITRKEAAAMWQCLQSPKSDVVELTMDEIPLFTFEETTIWNK